jgi:hypothetical protein
MPTVGEAMDKAFKSWYVTGMNYTIGIVRRYWLEGPRPKRLAVFTGNLRNRVDGKIFPDGFAVGTGVKYGIYWEKGIPAHTITAIKAKALAIPVGLAKGVTKGQAKKSGILKTGKMRGVIFRKTVHVPKHAPRKWLEPGVRQALPQVLNMGGRVMADVIRAGFPNKTVGP